MARYFGVIFFMSRILPSVFFVIFCLSTIGCEEQKKGVFLERGIAFFDQEKYKEAALEIKSAIQEDPTIAEPYYYMALLNEKAKKYKAMKVNLLESVKLDPSKTEAKLKLSKVHLVFNEIDEASKETESVLINFPDNLDALSIKASILIRQKKIEDALVIVNTILQKNPDHIEAISLKVAILMREKSFDQALAILLPTIQKNSDNVSLHLLKIQLDSQLDDVDAVVKDYERLVELKPDSVQAKFTLAKVYQKADQPQKVEDTLNSLIDENPNLMKVKIALLDFMFSRDEQKAISQCDVFVKKFADDHAKVAVFAKWLIVKNKKDKAKGVLSGAIAHNEISEQNKASLRLLLAKMEISDNKYTEALVFIEKVLKEDIDNADAKILKAGIQITQGQYSDARELLKEILWQKPKMDQALSLLAGVNEIEGDLDKALTNYENALKLNPKNMQALNYMVSKQVVDGHTNYAIEILERALRLAPSNLMVMTKLVELNSNEKKWDVTDRYINKIQLQKNGVLLAEYLKGNILQRQNKYEKAIPVYKGLLEKAPWIKDALTGLAECYSQINQTPKMISYLDQSIKDHPSFAFSYILKSRLLSIDRKYEQAIVLINDALKQGNIAGATSYVELGRLYRLSEDKDNEKKAYLEGLKVSPKNIDLMQHLAAGYENNGQFDEAVSLYEKILLINANHSVSKNNLATILIDAYGSPDKIEKAVLLVEPFRQAKQPFFLDTYGWAQLKSGNIEKSLAIFKQVVLIEPNIPVFRYHLAVAYNALGDRMRAISELKQALYLGKGKDFSGKNLIEQLLNKLQ